MMNFFKMLREEKGVVLIEYALIGALIAVALIATMGLLAGGIEGVFTKIITQLGLA